MARPIHLYWWRHRSGVLRNFGDELSPHLVSLLSGRSVEWAPVEACELTAVGSVLEHVLRTSRHSNPVVWGSGFISPDGADEPVELNASAVRGRLTAARVSGHPALGDPALLARHLIASPARRTGIGLVPHYRDLHHPMVRAFSSEVRGGRVISPLQHPRDVLTQIAACDAVVSSSLHGLIVADSLHVANRWIELSDSVLGAGYKFRDYFSCFGVSGAEPVSVRDTGDIDQAVSEARTMEARPGLEDLVAGLVEAFPSI